MAFADRIVESDWGKRCLVDGLRGGSIVGQGSGMKRASRQSPSVEHRHEKASQPLFAKQLWSRGRDRLVAVRRAICNSGNASNPAFGLGCISLTPDAEDPQGRHGNG